MLKDLSDDVMNEERPGKHVARGAHAAASGRAARAGSGAHAGNGAHAGSVASGTKKKRSSKKKDSGISPVVVGVAALAVVVLVCLLMFLPKKSTPVKTPEVTATPEVYMSENNNVVIGAPENGEASDGTELNGEAEQAEPVEEPVITPEPTPVANWMVGDTVTFGRYAQTGKSIKDKTGLEWYVVKRDGNYALLVSKNIVKFMKQSGMETCDYSESFVRDWLNNSEKGFGKLYTKGVSFLNTAFSTEEQAAITASAEFRSGSSVLEDKVFLLSEEELGVYSSLLGGGCYPTEYAVWEGQSIGLSTLQNGTYRWWWLRTTDAQQHFKFVNDLGQLGDKTKDANNDYGGIRPAMWVDLTKLTADMIG